MSATPLDAYKKTYRLRLSQGSRANSIEVTFPYQVVEKEARKHKLSVEEFIEKYHAVALFNGFDGVNYHFEEIPNGKTS